MKSVAQQLSEVATTFALPVTIISWTKLCDKTRGKSGIANSRSSPRSRRVTAWRLARKNGRLTPSSSKPQEGFGMTKEEAERFARPTGSSVEPKWADLLKETK